jgi:hypothetical protein
MPHFIIDQKVLENYSLPEYGVPRLRKKIFELMGSSIFVPYQTRPDLFLVFPWSRFA